MSSSRFDRAKQRLEDAKATKAGQQVATRLIEDLGSRGEKLLAQNLQDGERILAKLPGDFGQAFVVTDKHIFIVKWGYMAGSMFGGKCTSYSYRSISGLQIKQQALKALVQVLTPATQDNNRLSYWGGDSNNGAIKSDSAVTFSRQEAPQFQAAVNLAKEQMEPSDKPVSAVSGKDTVAMLDDLRKQGVISEAEYKQKVRVSLGL
ncbi:MAG TPA: hypothetical protein VLF59_01385 [Candidatus Saccharimonadales bacterium]|nr:hypothetical protein [Candidatus Saccharimonadales bacterium]